MLPELPVLDDFRKWCDFLKKTPGHRGSEFTSETPSPSFLSDCVEPARKVPVSVCVFSAALLGSAGWAATTRQTFQPRDRMQEERSCVWFFLSSHPFSRLIFLKMT